MVWKLATGLDVEKCLGFSGPEDEMLYRHEGMVASRIRENASNLVAMCGEEFSGIGQFIDDCWSPDRVKRPSAESILVYTDSFPFVSNWIMI